MDRHESNENPSESKSIGGKPRTWFRFFRRCFFRTALLLFVCTGSFVAAVWILGNIPVNRNFRHAESGVEILLVNNGVHVDLILPLESKEFRWLRFLNESDFKKFGPEYRYCMFGWGNKNFYMETETWDDLKISNVLYAFAGFGDTVVHTHLCTHIDWPDDRSRRIRLSSEQYVRLCEFLLETFNRRPDGTLKPIQGAHYGFEDAFFEANGHYHLFRTCNVWAGQAMSRSGVRVGCWTVTPDSFFACLPAPPRDQEIDTMTPR
ncbi:MAG: TIGR02117 family protein [Pirellula sp.]